MRIESDGKGNVQVFQGESKLAKANPMDCFDLNVPKERTAFSEMTQFFEHLDDVHHHFRLLRDSRAAEYLSADNILYYKVYLALLASHKLSILLPVPYDLKRSWPDSDRRMRDEEIVREGMSLFRLRDES